MSFSARTAYGRLIGFCLIGVCSYRRRLLTVPLLCSLNGRGFQVECPHQVERGLAQVEMVQRGPQVDDVPFFLAGRIETVEDVVMEVHAEGAAASVGAMDRTGAAFLRAWTAQARRQAEMLEDARDGQLTLEVGEVDEHALVFGRIVC